MITIIHWVSWSNLLELPALGVCHPIATCDECPVNNIAHAPNEARWHLTYKQNLKTKFPSITLTKRWTITCYCNCNICSRYYISHVKFTSYCELIECSRPIRFFIAVSLMYNNKAYHFGVPYSFQLLYYPWLGFGAKFSSSRNRPDVNLECDRIERNKLAFCQLMIYRM